MLRVSVLALETALATSVSITIDVLAMANRICMAAGRLPAFEVRLVGNGAHLFRPFLAFPEARHDAPELFIIPAQGLSKSDDYAARLAQPDAVGARELILAAAGAGARIASSCTGTLLLASTGLIDGHRATTAWWLVSVFNELFPAVSLETAELVLADGMFITAGAAMAQMDLMVGLIARYAGTEIAEGCAQRMILDERRSQIPYMAVGLLASSSESVAKAAAWARPRLGEGIGVNDIAAAVGQSARTFHRRVGAATGLSPIQFLQQLRVEQAVTLIETTNLPFEEVAYRVGYSDPSTLRGLIRRAGGPGPRELRSRVRRRSPSSGAPVISHPERGRHG